jgi:hypothetical protein
MAGSDPSQKRRNDTNATVLVPELGIPFLIPPLPVSCNGKGMIPLGAV